MFDKENQSLVLDILLAEKDVMAQYRNDYKLYIKAKDGRFIQVAEYFQPEINEVVKEMFRKKKLKYAMFFLESLELFSEMKPYSLKIMVYFLRHMKRNNTLDAQNIRLIIEKTGVSTRYVTMGLKQLMEMDLIRRKNYKNTFNYIVNPALSTRATMRSVFTVAEFYETYPCQSKSKPVFANFGHNSELK